MSAAAEPRYRPPVVAALLSKGNLFLVFLGTVFLIDFFAGSPLTRGIAGMIGRMQGLDPTPGASIRIITPLGTFTDRTALARAQDIAVFSVCYGVVLLSILYNGFLTLREPRQP